MTKLPSGDKKSSKGVKNIVIILIVIILFVGIPLIFLNYQAGQSGMSINEVVKRKMRITESKDIGGTQAAADSTGSKTAFMTAMPVGDKFTDKPQIANVLAADLDRDQLMDVLVCDSNANTV